MKQVADRAIIEQLQKQILSLQGNRLASDHVNRLGLGAMESAFHDKVFPRGRMHELISASFEDAACTSGFMSVVLAKLMQQGGSCLWIGNYRTIFPPALKMFGVEPERILFIDTKKVKDTLWAVEEALKCEALVAVVGEIRELSFNDSRRLQLAVERSKVTGFIHRLGPKAENPVACVTRWKISSMASATPDQMPGLGFPRWNIQLTKVRNGEPGAWQVQWSPAGLEYKGDAERNCSRTKLQTPEREAG